MDNPPLPPFTISNPTEVVVGQRVVWERPFAFTWGDLKITAGKARFEKASGTLEASGGVRIERGDEWATGERLTILGIDFEGLRLGESFSLGLERAALVSPPFSLASQQVTFRLGQGATATGVRFVPGTTGTGEVVVTAAAVTTRRDTDKLYFQDATLRLYGLRLLTVPRLTLRPSHSDQNRNQLSLPATLRSSVVSGTALGVNFPFVPGADWVARAQAEQTSRQGRNYLLTFRRSLLRTDERSDSPSLLDGGGNSARLAGYLTARKPFAPRVPGLGDVLSVPPAVPYPRRDPKPEAFLEAELRGNREQLRRAAQLLLSSNPDVRLWGALPGPRGAALTAELGSGRFSELRLTEGRRRVTAPRTVLAASAQAPSLTLGRDAALRTQVVSRSQRYPGGQHYDLMEYRAAAEYAASPRSGFGVGLIERQERGKSPFLWDTVEAQREGQLRGQLTTARWTIGALGRWDLKTNTLFDLEVTAGLRGRVIEPRLSWRSQNKVLSFTIGFPGLGL